MRGALGDQRAQDEKPASPPKHGPSPIGPKQMLLTELYTESRSSKGKGTSRPEPSGQMKLLWEARNKYPEFLMVARFGEAEVKVQMKLRPDRGFSTYPSHWVFSREPLGHWIIDLLWEKSEVKETLGTLEVQQAESGSAQSREVTFSWKPGNIDICKKAGIYVNDHKGWNTAVWKRCISS
jgi:hypothetical protein